MKISGFTIIRNAIKCDYPVVESITSILPLCDEFVVSVGNSEDDTLAQIRQIGSPKIRIIESIWDDTIRQKGKILSIETDRAFRALSSDTTWAFYLQSDEIVHEKYLEKIHKALTRYQSDIETEGLLFNYLHFYGDYQYVADSWRWYSHEIRVVKNDPDIFSYRDAQGFRHRPNRKLRVRHVDAYIYHYGWVKPPETMLVKKNELDKYFHSDEKIQRQVRGQSVFDYSSIDSLRKFTETHPAVMRHRVASKGWTFEHDFSKNRFSRKEKWKRRLSRWLGFKIGEYKNYKLLPGL